MCGIAGYVGKRQAAPILLEGLRRLEYRGYDSAGVAILEDHRIQIHKKQGKIDEGLGRLLEAQPLTGTLGIGHTRWATHGPPPDENSHPHLDQSGKIALVHNGVIENFEALKRRFLEQGHTFASSTDTEVLAHLIGEHYARPGKGSDGVHPLAQASSVPCQRLSGVRPGCRLPRFPGRYDRSSPGFAVDRRGRRQ